MSVFVNILAAIGLIFIISTLIYYIYIYVKNKIEQRKHKEINPPLSYMQNTGIKCPDYWVNTGVDENGNYICRNSFNITTVPKTNSYKTKCNSNNLIFSKLPENTTWELNDPHGLTSLTDIEKYRFVSNNKPNDNENLLSRCEWINNCGPSTSVQGVWSGINEICNGSVPK
jgi:hypothetical protein